jgi:predicted dienelactone hydrolase
MKYLNALIYTLAITAWLSIQVHAAGFTRIAPSADQLYDLGIWYPTDVRAPSEPNSPFGQALAIDAQIVGDDLPLIVISHGNAGWMGGHADTALALAEAGFVVAALTHSDDNYENENVSPSVWVVSRPREVASSITYMLERWTYAARLSAEKIGVFGFSAGGFTALVAAGGVPDFKKAKQHCDKVPTEFVCELGLVDEVHAADLKTISHALASDTHIKALSIAAPGFGFAFTGESLNSLDIPVQIWSGSLDQRVPHDTNGGLIADELVSTPDIEIVEGAGHFSFLQPCRPELESNNPRIWQMICVDADTFDRAEFHHHLNNRVAEFFDQALNQ